MSVRRVPLSITEDAIFLLRSTYWEAVNAQDSPKHGRIAQRQSDLSSYNSFSREATYLRLVSIVEVFVDAANGRQFSSYIDGQMGGPRRALMAVARDQSNLTWHRRKEVFESYHGVSFGDTQGWSDFETAIDVRNAIAHRLGRLARITYEKRVKYGQIHVGVVGQVIVIEQRSLDKCLELSVSFVTDLDQLVRGQ